MRIYRNGQRMRERLFSAGYIPIFGGVDEGYEFLTDPRHVVAAVIYYNQDGTVCRVRFFEESGQ